MDLCFRRPVCMSDEAINKVQCLRGINARKAYILNVSKKDADFALVYTDAMLMLFDFPVIHFRGHGYGNTARLTVQGALAMLKSCVPSALMHSEVI